VRELLRTHDPVLVGFVEVLLREAGFVHHVADANISVVEGSIGIFPKRILVVDDDHADARRLLVDAGLERELVAIEPGDEEASVHVMQKRRAVMTPASSTETDDTFLGGALRILQPLKGFRAGLDAVLLAAAVPDSGGRPFRVLDAGAGVGVAGLCLAARVAHATVTLLERAPELGDLARRNVDRNGLADRVHVVEADLLGRPDHLRAAGLEDRRFDLVMTNPPWLETGRGRASADALKADANAMPEEALDGWLRLAARVLVPGGLIVLLHRADAIARVLAGLDRRFGDIEILPIHPRRGEPAHRILVRARQGSRGSPSVLAGLVLHEGTAFRPDIEAMTRNGAALAWPGRT
jgi:tRNA1(Val) A37 N6-methylase TrmN6